jgi:uncharacterized protein DUF1707
VALCGDCLGPDRDDSSVGSVWHIRLRPARDRSKAAGLPHISCVLKRSRRTTADLCSLAVDEVGPQPGNPLSVRGRLRVGDRGKELAAGLLQRAFAKGQLSKDDLDDRLSLVLEARVRNDLRPALEDLEEYQLVRLNPRLWAYWLD